MGDSLNFSSASASRNEMLQRTNSKSGNESQLIEQNSEKELSEQQTAVIRSKEN